MVPGMEGLKRGKPCSICGGMRFHERPWGAVCSTCHPPENKPPVTRDQFKTYGGKGHEQEKRVDI